MEKEKLIKLVTGAQSGDPSAIDALFSDFYNDVYYFALKTVQDQDLACDITQETFLEIIRTIGDLKEPAAFVTWMKQITYHQCTRYFKKKKEVLVEEDEDGNTVFDTLADESEGSIPSEVYEKEEFRNTILGIINELTEQQRSAIMMYYFDELTVGQIARIQNVSEGTVKSRLNYARKAIKTSVEDYEKKHDVRLHSVGLLPLLLLFFGKELMPAEKAAEVGATVSQSASAMSAGTAVASAGSGMAAAGTAAGMVTLPMGIKLLGAAVAIALAVVAGVALTQQPPAPETQPSSLPITTTPTTAPGDPDDQPAGCLHQFPEDSCLCQLCGESFHADEDGNGKCDICMQDLYPAATETLTDKFIDALGLLDHFYNYDYHYMIRIVCDEFVFWDSEGMWHDTDVPAEEFEAVLHKYFVLTDDQIRQLRELGNRDYYTDVYDEQTGEFTAVIPFFDEAAQTYHCSFYGGFGGILAPRQYLGYIQNGDTYEVYYQNITYAYLEDYLPEGVDEWEYVESLDYPEFIELEGLRFEGGPNGYYTVLSYDSYGRKYTVEIVDDVVRIISCEDYTESQLPDAFDDDDQ